MSALLAAAPAEALGQDPPKDAASAVKLARSAFEFRDLKKVVEILRPWVRPMRIFDRKLQVEARMLMGVSLHLLGREQEAKEEFGELLLLEPKYELDPFVVPPEVIGTFEAVRRSLRPTLDRILKERGEKPPPKAPPVRLELVRVPHRATAFLPLGVPQFLLDEPGWGSAYALVQILGVVGNVAAFFAQGPIARSARGRTPPEPPSSDPAYQRLVGLQYGALAVAILAYAGSVIHGFFLLDDLEADLAARGGDGPPGPGG